MTWRKQQSEGEPSFSEEDISAILEVKVNAIDKLQSICPFCESAEWLTLVYVPQEEEALIAAHRKEIENTMEIVREVRP